MVGKGGGQEMPEGGPAGKKVGKDVQEVLASTPNGW
jgi:hypothetical protein